MSVVVLRMRTRNLARMMVRFETLARLALEDQRFESAEDYARLRDAARQRRSALLRRMWEEQRGHAYD